MIEFKVDDTKLKRIVTNQMRAFQSTSQFLFQVGQSEVNQAKFRIRTSKTDPNGRPWQRWAPATVKSRARRGTLTRGLLYDTGRLYNSFTVSSNNQRVTIKNTTEYSGYLQRGTLRMPRREFLGFGRDSKKEIIKLFQNYMKRWK
jgi:phage gpG-like protein